MSKTVLITGGAGFIGSHLADELLSQGYKVRALDNLNVQVHGQSRRRPDYLNQSVELIVGDVRNRDLLAKCLNGVQIVYHLAAAVGVGQSMYQIADYVEVNSTGTAILLEELIRNPVERLIVASSMSVYGEGLYQDADGRLVSEATRNAEASNGHWDIRDSAGRSLTPLPTPEHKRPLLASVYALSKFDQERLCLMIGSAYKLPTVALRFFNTYGPRQALSNPYTGVLAIFASRLLNDKPPMIFEDGLQQRDFVSVHDVARACVLAAQSPKAPGKVFNIASGRPFTVMQVASKLAKLLGKEDFKPQLTGQYRVGDIRHCFADISEAREELGYQPKVTLDKGLTELAQWLRGQVAVDLIGQAKRELEQRNLAI